MPEYNQQMCKICGLWYTVFPYFQYRLNGFCSSECEIYQKTIIQNIYLTIMFKYFGLLRVKVTVVSCGDDE